MAKDNELCISFHLLTDKSDQLFDKADEDSEGDLFGRTSGGLFDDDYSTVTSPPAAKSKGDAVADADLFKSKGQGLFDETDEEVEETVEKQPVPQPKPSASSKPTFGGGGGGGLFDDDSDSDMGGGGFTVSTSKVSQKDAASAPPGKPIASSLFEDDGDLFGASPPEGGGGQKKKPVGGVSLFGDEPSTALNAAVKKVSVCVCFTAMLAYIECSSCKSDLFSLLPSA